MCKLNVLLSCTQVVFIVLIIFCANHLFNIDSDDIALIRDTAALILFSFAFVCTLILNMSVSLLSMMEGKNLER